MSGIPARGVPQTVTVLTAGTSTDRYGQPSTNWATGTSRQVQALLQPATATEDQAAGRDALLGVWTMFTNDDGITGYDRILDGDGNTYEVLGPPQPVSTPDGYHHSELSLKIVEA